jgi:hypothetical protein
MMALARLDGSLTRLEGQMTALDRRLTILEWMVWFNVIVTMLNCGLVLLGCVVRVW